MTTNTFAQRLTEIRNIQKEYKLLYQLGGGLLIFLIGIWIGSLIFTHDNGYATNVFTEILSIIATIVFIDRLNTHRHQQHETRQLQQQLIMDTGSKSNEKATDAINQLHKFGWIEGEESLLKGKNLRFAKLQSAYLEGANLEKTNLQGVNLERTNLIGANLSQTNLNGAYLKQTTLRDANLEQADLTWANLRYTNLQGANLEQVNMRYASLSKANLQGVNLENATLSDTRLYKTNLFRANLKRTKFLSADLDRANLQRTNLENAFLFRANLAGANLKYANLHLALFRSADLQGTDFRSANLYQATFHKDYMRPMIFNEHTILPDDTNYDPSQDRDEQLEPFINGYWHPLWMKPNTDEPKPHS